MIEFMIGILWGLALGGTIINYMINEIVAGGVFACTSIIIGVLILLKLVENND